MFAGRVDKPVSVERMKIAVEEAVAEEFKQ
jgi:hypothetical protein